jgi:hypothetical protein
VEGRFRRKGCMPLLPARPCRALPPAKTEAAPYRGARARRAGPQSGPALKTYRKFSPGGTPLSADVRQNQRKTQTF